MRWRKRHPGERRIVKRFALFPIEAGEGYVWLETVYVLYEYMPAVGWVAIVAARKEDARKMLEGL